MIDKVKVHKELLDNMHDVYVRKNHDYGDSVHETYERYGMTSFLVRMEDKMNRIRTLDEAEDINLIIKGGLIFKSLFENFLYNSYTLTRINNLLVNFEFCCHMD